MQGLQAAVAVLVGCYFGLLALSASAATIVDATNFCCFPSASGGQGGGVINSPPFAYYERAQTFVIANSGTLTALDLIGTAQAPQYVGTLFGYIVPVSNGIPATDLSLALGSTSLVVDFTPPFGLPLTLSGLSVPVSQGEVLAVVLAAGLKTGGTTAFDIYGSPVDYPFGRAFFRTTGDAGVPPMTWVSDNELDLAFRTYVDCSSAHCVAASSPPDPHAVPDHDAPTGVLLALAAALVVALTDSTARRATKAPHAEVSHVALFSG